MTTDESQGKHGLASEAALRRQAERAALKQAREAEALRANLKRRKEQARGRSVTTSGEQVEAAGSVASPRQQDAT